MDKKSFSIKLEDNDNYWANAFKNQLERSAVQPVRHESIYSEISSIMGNSKYQSVEAAVKEMQERSGLKAYIEKIKQAGMEKKTSDNNDVIDKKIPVEQIKEIKSEDINLFKKYPNIKLNDIINNLISSNESIEVPQLKHRLINMFKNEIPSSEFNEPKFLIFVDNLIVLNHKNYSSQDKSHLFGLTENLKSNTSDLDNQDPLSIMVPNKQ